MAERHLIVDQLKFSYEGLFNASEVYNIVSSFFFEKGWDWYEKMNQEQITPSGKQIRLILEPWKSSSDYYKLLIQIKLNMIDVKEVEVQQEGQNLRLDHGIIRMIINGYVVSDRFGKWKGKPLLWFLGIVLEKYFFKEHFQKLERWVKSDVEDLHEKIKRYLNVFKNNYQ